MIKIIVNLCSKKGDNNDKSSRQFFLPTWYIHNNNCWHPEINVSRIEGKSVISKVRTLFSCSVCAMYIIVNHAQNQCIVLKPSIPGNDSLI